MIILLENGDGLLYENGWNVLTEDRQDYAVSLSGGAFTLTGGAVTLLKHSLLSIGTGVFALTGLRAVFNLGTGIWLNKNKTRSDWGKVAKTGGLLLLENGSVLLQEDGYRLQIPENNWVSVGKPSTTWENVQKNTTTWNTVQKVTTNWT